MQLFSKQKEQRNQLEDKAAYELITHLCRSSTHNGMEKQSISITHERIGHKTRLPDLYRTCIARWKQACLKKTKEGH